MRSGQYLDYEALRLETEKAVAQSGRTQRVIAAELRRVESAVSQAMHAGGSRFARLQREIIALLTDYEVTGEPTFRVRRKVEERP